MAVARHYNSHSTLGEAAAELDRQTKTVKRRLKILARLGLGLDRQTARGALRRAGTHRATVYNHHELVP